jgi:hypothetical protein
MVYTTLLKGVFCVFASEAGKFFSLCLYLSSRLGQMSECKLCAELYNKISSI